MTIERVEYSIEYEITGNDPTQTAFAFEFPVKEPSQIHCYDITPEGNEDKSDIVEAIAAGYFRVSAAPGGYAEGGNVELVVPLAVGHVLRISRMTPATQKKTFSNQDRLRLEEIEDALDLIVMWMQENNPAEIRSFITKLEAGLKEEASARESGDDALVNFVDEETKARIEAIKAIQAQVDEKMPKAPDDGGHYVGSGGEWIPAEIAPPADPEPPPDDPPPTDELGGIFDFDADGDVVIVERTEYDPNTIWNISSGELILSEASQPGDTDGVFIIDADGDAVLVE